MRNDTNLSAGLRLFAESGRPMTPALARAMLRVFSRAGRDMGAGPRAWLSRDEELALRYTGESWDPLVVAAYLNTTPIEVQRRLHSAARKLSAVLGPNGDFGAGDRAPGPRPDDPPALTVAKPLDDEADAEAAD